MEQDQFETFVTEEQIIPVVTMRDAAYAVSLAETLLEAGFRTIEITLRTAGSLQAIQAIAASDCPIVVGAGSISRVEDIHAAVDAGAEFLVSAGLNPELVDEARKSSMAYLPGIATPSEILTGIGMGIDLFKFFPAEALGGTKYLKAISAPFPAARFVPTGGIRPESLRSYLDMPSVLACGGSWLTPADALQAGDMDRIKHLAWHARTLR